MTAPGRELPGAGAAAAIVIALLAWTGWEAVNARPVPAPGPDMRIDLNTAEAPALSALPGIGPGLARRIEGDRRDRGPFASIADLRRVPGIGPRTVERVAPHVVAGGADERR